MASLEEHSGDEPYNTSFWDVTSQSVASSKHPLSNSSTRRAHFHSAPTELSDSVAGARDDMMMRGLHQRSSRRVGSSSQLGSDHIVDNRPSIDQLEDEYAQQQNRDSAVLQVGHQARVDVNNGDRDVSDDLKSIASVRSEQTFLQRRDLGMLDVAALIINKQIGTGIFTTPGLVLSLTGSKTVSIVMWFCGGIWAFLR